jgi:Na+-driven multidrug efflux pump
LYFSIAGGLRGAGDTIWPLISSSIGIYGGRLFFALVVYHLFHPPVYLIWCSMFPDLIIRIVLIMVRLRGGKWKTGRV